MTKHFVICAIRDTEGRTHYLREGTTRGHFPDPYYMQQRFNAENPMVVFGVIVGWRHSRDMTEDELEFWSGATGAKR